MKLLKPEEVAGILGVSRSTAMRMMHENSIPTIRLRSGRRKQVLRCNEESLTRWLASRERESQRTAKIVSVAG